MSSVMILQPGQSIMVEADRNTTEFPHYCVVMIKANGTISTSTGQIVKDETVKGTR